MTGSEFIRQIICKSVQRKLEGLQLIPLKLALPGFPQESLWVSPGVCIHQFINIWFGEQVLSDAVYFGILPFSQSFLFFQSIEAFYLHLCITFLEKESQDFPSCMFSFCFFMAHDAQWVVKASLNGRKSENFSNLFQLLITTYNFISGMIK